MFGAYGKGVRLAKKGHFDEAVPLLEQAVREEANDGKRHYWLGAALVTNKQYARGIDELVAALRLTTDSTADRADILYALGYAHNALAQWDAARRYLTEAVAVSRGGDVLEHTKGLNHLAAATLQCGDRAEALRLVNESLALMASNGKKFDNQSPSATIKARAQLVHATVLRAMGKRAEATTEANCALQTMGQCKLPDAVLEKEINAFLNPVARHGLIARVLMCGALGAFVVGAVAVVAL